MKPGDDARVVFGVDEKQGYGAVGEGQGYLKPQRRRQHTFLFQLAEDEIRIDRIFRVAKTPSGIAETDLFHSRLHAEPELVVNPERPPALDTVLVGSGPSHGFDFRMPVEYAVGDAVDPIPPVTDLAVGHVSKMWPQRPTQGAEHLLDGVERNASDQQ